MEASCSTCNCCLGKTHQGHVHMVLVMCPKRENYLGTTDWPVMLVELIDQTCLLPANGPCLLWHQMRAPFFREILGVHMQNASWGIIARHVETVAWYNGINISRKCTYLTCTYMYMGHPTGAEDVFPEDLRMGPWPLGRPVNFRCFIFRSRGG